MKPKYHVLIGFLFSLTIYLIFPSIGIIGGGIIFFSSFLIDFDHYLYYFIEEKDLNLKKAYFWFLEKGKIIKKLPTKRLKNFYTGVEIFHGLEWVFIFYLFGFYLTNLFYFVALGMFLHLSLDWISQRKIGIYPRKFSLIYDLIMVKKKKLILIKSEGSNKV